jgi:hypothetical protein
MGDLNLDPDELNNLRYEVGFSRLLDMKLNKLDYTQNTRKNVGQTLRQVDYIFSDLPI